MLSSNLVANAHIDSPELYKEALLRGLKEDGFPLDWTTLAVNSQQSKKAIILAKTDGVFCGEGLLHTAQQIALEWGLSLKIETRLQNGQKFKKGDILSQWIGTASGLLVLERPTLNLLAYLCSVAAETHRLVEAVRQLGHSHPTRVTATRKTLPFYRDLAVTAVRVGGGDSHRVSLSGGVLLKENHLRFSGSITKAIEHCRQVAPHLMRIEVEVTNLVELREAIAARADVVMLDNFPTHDIQEALKIRGSSALPLFEVSGGIRPENVEQYVLNGIDIVSSGSLTYRPTPVDLSFLVES